MAWQYHTGWPYTALNFEQVERPDGSFGFSGSYGPVNAERFPPYHRLDVRVHRYFDFTNSRLSIFVEVRNLYNRKNVRLYEYRRVDGPGGEPMVMRDPQDWLPILPSIGLSWDF